MLACQQTAMRAAACTWQQCAVCCSLKDWPASAAAALAASAAAATSLAQLSKLQRAESCRDAASRSDR
eukprot:6049-Heterococcus_DN1.PRE.1